MIRVPAIDIPMHSFHVVRLKLQKSAIPANAAAAIATPPPRGVGTVWELRLLGISRIFLFKAYRRIIQVRINEVDTTKIDMSMGIMLEAGLHSVDFKIQ